MIDEQQIRKIVDDRFNQLSLLKHNEIDKIILNSKFHTLMFAGLATTVVSQITPRFHPSIVQGKKLLIKRIQVIPYANAPAIDISLTDGITTTTETVPANMRLQRTLEAYSASLNIKFEINGSAVDIFSDDPAGATFWYPLDMDIDNIYYLYKDPVETLNFRCAAQIYTDFVAALGVPLLNILVECYTF